MNQRTACIMRIILLFLCVLAFGCQSKTESTSSEGTADSTSELAFPITPPPQAGSTAENVASYQSGEMLSISQYYESWVGDSLVAILSRKKKIEGELIDVYFISDHFLEADNPNSSRNLLAVLIQSGAGEYTGTQMGSSGVPLHEVVYSTLAVYDADNEFALVDEETLDAAGSGGLILSSHEAEAMELAKGKSAALVHFKSSESGAGDGGYDRDNGSVYALLNNEIKLILEIEISDEGFVSDETSSTSSHKSTTTFTILENANSGLSDLQLVTDSSSDYETSEPTESDPEDTSEHLEMVYRWNGEEYVCYQGCGD